MIQEVLIRHNLELQLLYCNSFKEGQKKLDVAFILKIKLDFIFVSHFLKHWDLQLYFAVFCI